MVCGVSVWNTINIYIIYIYILYNIYIHGKTTFHLTQNFQGSKTSSQSRQMYNKKKNNCQFLSYMGPNVKKNVHFWLFYSYLGGGSWGALMSNPVLPNFQGSKISSQSRQIYNKEKK